MNRLFLPFLEERGYPTLADDITDEHFVEFLATQRDRVSPGTGRKLEPAMIAIYDRCLRAFFT